LFDENSKFPAKVNIIFEGGKTFPQKANAMVSVRSLASPKILLLGNAKQKLRVLLCIPHTEGALWLRLKYSCSAMRSKNFVFCFAFLTLIRIFAHKKGYPCNQERL
jgi:hypothetical protein